jgi:hypothetical protein
MDVKKLIESMAARVLSGLACAVDTEKQSHRGAP